MAGPGRPTNDPNDYFAFGVQSAKDVVTAAFQFPKHLDGSGFDVDQESDRIHEGGDGQEVGLSYRTMVKADPQLIALARPVTSAQMWAGVLGIDTVGSAAVATLARHTLSPAASLPYHTIEQRSGDIVERVTNGVFTSLAYEGEAGKPWTLTGQMLSAGTVTIREAGSALTPSRELGKPHFYPNGSYLVDGFASYAQLLTKVKVEVQRGVDDGIQTTGLAREDVVPLSFDVNVDATVKVTSRDFYRKCRYTPTGSTIPVDFATGSLDLSTLQSTFINGSVSAVGLHRVVCPLLEWIDAKINRLDPDGKTVYLDVVGASVKGATNAIFAQIDTVDIPAYV